MKASEFRKLIREEVEGALREQTTFQPNASPEEIKTAIIPILAKLEKDIDAASKNISIALTKRAKDTSKAAIPTKDIMITRKGVEEVKKLITLYKSIADAANVYISYSNTPGYKRTAPQVLAKLNKLLQQGNL